MRRLRAAFRRTFRSVATRNYRLYFLGQTVSITGTWMQSVAQAWLVLRLTGSGVALGFTSALQFAPMLVAGPWGGVIADRVDRRRMLIATQAAAGALALVLGLLTLTNSVQLWMVYALALALGVVNLLDNPTRQAFVTEMVQAEDVPNAVSLNSVVVNGGRVIGPAVAGILIATVGLATCFLANAASYLAVIAGLMAMRPAELVQTQRMGRGRGQLRDGLRYAWSNRELRDPLLLMAVVGTLAYNFQVLLPLLARYAFHGGAATFGTLYSLMGVGAVVGGLVIATRSRVSGRLLAGSAVGFGVLILLVAVAPTLALEMAAVGLMGVASTAFIATATSTLQLRSAPEMRGRIMALWAVVFLGSTPIGSPTVGFIAEHFGPRWAMGLGGAATLVAGAISLWSEHRKGNVPRSIPVAGGSRLQEAPA